MAETEFRRRPAVLTLVGIVIFIAGLTTGVTAITILLNKDTVQWQNVYDMSSTELFWMGVFEGIFALLLFAVGYGVMVGAKGSRLLVAIVLAVRLAGATWFMLNHLGSGAFSWALIVQMAFALFALWALYGHKQSQEYFESFEGWTAA